jgi:hypothetical protein
MISGVMQGVATAFELGERPVDERYAGRGLKRYPREFVDAMPSELRGNPLLTLLQDADAEEVSAQNGRVRARLLADADQDEGGVDRDRRERRRCETHRPLCPVGRDHDDAAREAR